MFYSRYEVLHRKQRQYKRRTVNGKVQEAPYILHLDSVLRSEEHNDTIQLTPEVWARCCTRGSCVRYMLCSLLCFSKQVVYMGSPLVSQLVSYLQPQRRRVPCKDVNIVGWYGACDVAAPDIWHAAFIETFKIVPDLRTANKGVFEDEQSEGVPRRSQQILRKAVEKSIKATTRKFWAPLTPTWTL